MRTNNPSSVEPTKWEPVQKPAERNTPPSVMLRGHTYTQSDDSEANSSVHKVDKQKSSFNPFRAISQLGSRIWTQIKKSSASLASLFKSSHSKEVTYKGEKNGASSKAGLDTNRQRLRNLTSEGEKDSPLIEITNGNASVPYNIDAQFKADLHRCAQFKLNQQVLYDKQRIKSKNYNTYEICDELKKKFGSRMMTNLTLLLNQANLADLSKHILSMSGGDATGAQAIIYSVEEKGDKLELTVEVLLRIRDSVNGDANKDFYIGYINAKRKIIISKEELNKDWTRNESKDEQPKMKVIDSYSRLATTGEEAQKHLKKISA